MRGFSAILRKELREQLRTFRLLAAVVTLTLFGTTAVLIIKFLPQLLELTGEAVTFRLPQFTASQALAEYGNTMAQIGSVAIIMYGMGIVARERERGTALLTLSKPVATTSFVMAKLVALMVTFGIAMVVAAGFTYTYGLALFEGAPTAGFWAMNGLVGVYLLFVMSVVLLCSCLFRSQLAAGGLALVVVMGLRVASALPGLAPYLPGGIMEWGRALAIGEAASATWNPLVIALGLSVLAIVGSWSILRTREL